MNLKSLYRLFLRKFLSSVQSVYYCPSKNFPPVNKKKIIDKLVKLADNHLVCLLAIIQDNRAKILEIET